jgi:hypothetical protein
MEFVLFCSVWNKEGLSDQWKESIVVPFYKKDDKSDRSNYGGISSILSRLRIYIYIDGLTGDH